MRSSFDADFVRVLAGILTETGLTEIEITEKDSRVRVVRTPPPVVQAVPVAQPPIAASPAAAPSGVPSGAPSAAIVDDADHPGAVTSPMVGVAYLAPEPGAPAYVTVGQSVSAGQTLLLIEAMKTFNQVRAAQSGTVTRILVSSGVPVEFGEPLMIIE